MTLPARTDIPRTPPLPPGSLPWLEVPRPARLRLQRAGFVAATVLPFAGAVAAVVFSCATGFTWVAPTTFLLMLVVSALGIEVGYHRLFSHASFQASPGLRAFLAIAGATAVQGPVIYWVAHHRLHHASTDRAGDPHSPHLFRSRLRGFLHAHLGWIFAPTRASAGRFARDLLNDRRLAGINRHFLLWILLGLVVPAAIGAVGTRSWQGAVAGLLWGGFARVFVAQHTTYAVNSICHLFGRQPFTGKDQSRNVDWLVLPTFGGSLHNNHHAFPASADLRFFPGELDLSGLFIRLMARAGWAWDVKRPSDTQILRRQNHLNENQNETEPEERSP